MADYKWRVSGSVLCPGADWLPPEIYPNIDWQDRDALTGSQDTQAVIRNSDSSGYQRQRVDVNVANSWSVRWDKNNFMYVDLNCRLDGISGSIYQGGRANYCNRHAVIRHYQGGPLLVDLEYSANATGLIRGGSSLGTWTLGPIAPKSESAQKSFYLANWSVGYATEDDCNKYGEKYTAGIQFYNNRNLEYDAPVITSTSCQGYSSGGQFSATGNFGDYRINASVKFQISNKEDFSTILYETTKNGNSDQRQTITWTKTELQPNTRYYVRYQASNGAKTSVWSTCSFVTLVTNNLSDPKALRWDKGQVHLAIQMGDGVYTNPQTKIYVKQCGTDTWVEKVTRTTKTVADVEISGLNENTCYEVQARTTTPAGTYTGNTVTFTTPQKNVATAVFTSIDAAIDEEENDTYADMCYDYESTTNPIDITVYYRVKNGTDQTWQHSETVTFNQNTGSYCITIHNLFPNQITYETYIKTTCDGNDWTGQITEFITPLMPVPPNYTCENMDYLVDLICQAVVPLYKGNKTIYANPTTKELCDPYSKNPTMATLWSRLLRFDHAAACLLCEMAGLAKMKGGKSNQYYVGEIGWHNMATEIVEESEDLVESGTVKDYIEAKIHEVWHFHGNVDYLTGTVAELPTRGLIVGDTAIEATTSSLYRYNNNHQWVKDTSFEVDDFAIFHIEKALKSSFGNVKANQAYYYFDGTWNNLDADTRDIERRLAILESQKIAIRQNESEDMFTIQTNNEHFNYASLPSGERIICFVTEDVNLPPEGKFRITYDTGEGGTIIPDEEVTSGATAQRPANPTKIGFVFNHWEDKNTPGTAFNFSTVILKNYDLVAVWDAEAVTVTFDIRPEIGTLGTAPIDEHLHYGDPVPMPDNSSFYLQNGTFVGWMRDGILVNASDTLKGDTTLVAKFEMDEFDVVFHPENGNVNTTIHCTGGTVINPPEDPTRANYVFVGWYTAQTGGQRVTDFSEFVYGPADFWAHWVPATYTITFRPGGGNEDFTQTVNYLSTVERPSSPEWRL